MTCQQPRSLLLLVMAMLLLGAGFTSPAQAADEPPAAPTNLRIPSNDGTHLTLTWSPAADVGPVNGAATSYVVQRSQSYPVAESERQELVTVSGATTSVVLDVPPDVPGTSWYWWVVAVNSGGRSSSSPTMPPGSFSSQARSHDGTHVTFTWQPPAQVGTEPVSRIEVDRFDAFEDSYVRYTHLPADATSIAVDAPPVGEGNSTRYRIRPVSNAGPGGYALFLADTTLPPAPYNLRLSAPSATERLLRWSIVDGGSAPVTSFTVQRSTGGATFEDVVTVDPSARSAVLAGPPEGQIWRWRLTATSNVGTSPPSASTAPPDAPQNVRVGALTGDTATVQWGPTTSQTAPVDGFVVDTSDDGGTTWSGAVTVTDPGVRSASVPRLPAPAAVFRVRARSAAGLGDGATTVIQAPSPPSLRLLAASYDVASLAWTPAAANTSPTTAYVIELSTGDGSTWTEVRRVEDPSATAVTVPAPPTGATWSWRIRAVSLVGPGLPSSTVTATTRAPDAPVLSLVPASFPEVGLRWTTGAPGSAPVSAFVVERSVDDGVGWDEVRRVDGAARTTSVPLPPTGTSWTWRVIATSAAGASDPSNVVTTTTRAPDAPTALSVVSAGVDAVVLRWTPGDSRTSPSTAFIVERSTDDQTWAVVASIGAATAQTTVEAPPTGATWRWRVIAASAAGPSAPSATAAVTTSAPDQPTGLRVTDATRARVRLAWAAAVGNTAPVAAYLVQQSVDGAEWTRAASVTVTSATLTAPAAGGTWAYRVIAVSAAGAGEPSEVARLDSREVSEPGEPGVSVDAGAVFTNEASVQLHLRWPYGVTGVLISNDGGFSDVTPRPVARAASWTLTQSGAERLPKTVYVRFVADGVTLPGTYTDDIILDQTAPVVQTAQAVPTSNPRPSVTATPRPVTLRATRAYRVKLRASDLASGIASVQLTSAKNKPGKTLPYRTSYLFRVKTTGATSAKIFVRVRDRAGNVSAWKVVRVKR